MGGGLPLAATTGRRDLIEGFRAQTRYFNTFAASPLQGAVGLAGMCSIWRFPGTVPGQASILAQSATIFWPATHRAAHYRTMYWNNWIFSC